MWRFYLLRFERSCALVGVIALSLCAGMACPAQAADEEIARTAQADHSIVIREHAGWNMECEAIAHPALYLNEPPRHGSICARLQDIKIRSIFAGTEAQCVGRVVRGVQLIYRPDAGFVGDDRLSYAAQYPSVLRPVVVSVTVAPFPPATPRASPSGFSVPVTPARQAPGQVPPCEDLVF
jgi:hypothetical protein